MTGNARGNEDAMLECCVLIATGAEYRKLDTPGRERFDGLDERAVKRAGHRAVASDHRVGLPVLDHQGAEIVRTGDDFLRVGNLQAAVAADILHPLAKQREVAGLRRIDQVDESERDIVLRGDGADALAIA